MIAAPKSTPSSLKRLAARARHSTFPFASRARRRSCRCEQRPRTRTEWVLLTSGTTGVPKMVVHDLPASLPPSPQSPADGAAVWGTFYDIRRYGGLQIFLRAVFGGASLVLSSAGEPVADHLARSRSTA